MFEGLFQPMHLLIIFAIALLIFGPKKLPEIGRSMGKALRGFQDASRDFESEFTREAKQLEEAVATSSKQETEKLSAASKQDTADT